MYDPATCPYYQAIKDKPLIISPDEQEQYDLIFLIGQTPQEVSHLLYTINKVILPPGWKKTCEDWLGLTDGKRQKSILEPTTTSGLLGHPANNVISRGPDPNKLSLLITNPDVDQKALLALSTKIADTLELWTSVEPTYVPPSIKKLSLTALHIFVPLMYIYDFPVAIARLQNSAFRLLEPERASKVQAAFEARHGPYLTESEVIANGLSILDQFNANLRIKLKELKMPKDTIDELISKVKIKGRRKSLVSWYYRSDTERKGDEDWLGYKLILPDSLYELITGLEPANPEGFELFATYIRETFEDVNPPIPFDPTFSRVVKLGHNNDYTVLRMDLIRNISRAYGPPSPDQRVEVQILHETRDYLNVGSHAWYKYIANLFHSLVTDAVANDFKWMVLIANLRLLMDDGRLDEFQYSFPNIVDIVQSRIDKLRRLQREKKLLSTARGHHLLAIAVPGDENPLRVCEAFVREISPHLLRIRAFNVEVTPEMSGEIPPLVNESEFLGVNPFRGFETYKVIPINGSGYRVEKAEPVPAQVAGITDPNEYFGSRDNSPAWIWVPVQDFVVPSNSRIEAQTKIADRYSDLPTSNGIMEAIGHADCNDSNIPTFLPHGVVLDEPTIELLRRRFDKLKALTRNYDEAMLTMFIDGSDAARHERRKTTQESLSELSGLIEDALLIGTFLYAAGNDTAPEKSKRYSEVRRGVRKILRDPSKSDEREILDAFFESSAATSQNPKAQKHPRDYLADLLSPPAPYNPKVLSPWLEVVEKFNPDTYIHRWTVAQTVTHPAKKAFLSVIDSHLTLCELADATPPWEDRTEDQQKEALKGLNYDFYRTKVPNYRGQSQVKQNLLALKEALTAQQGKKAA